MNNKNTNKKMKIWIIFNFFNALLKQRKETKDWKIIFENWNIVWKCVSW